MSEVSKIRLMLFMMSGATVENVVFFSQRSIIITVFDRMSAQGTHLILGADGEAHIVQIMSVDTIFFPARINSLT